MKLAVCLLSCGRPHLTALTAASFMAMNPLLVGRAAFLHADDESCPENRHAAQLAGFRTIHEPRDRLGLMAGLRALVHAAAEEGCDCLLWLENDWESVRPIANVPMLTRGPVGVECLRLYGAQKQLDGKRPAGRLDMTTGMVILWERVDGAYEAAQAHWGGAPSVTWLDLLAEHCDDAPTMKDMARQVGSLRTIRPLENFMWHTGAETTPEFRQ